MHSHCFIRNNEDKRNFEVIVYSLTQPAEILHPQKPGPRRPLHGTMDNSMREKNQLINTKTRKQSKEPNHDSVDDSYTDDSQSDKESILEDSVTDEGTRGDESPAESSIPRNTKSPSSPPQVLRKHSKLSNSSQKGTGAEKELNVSCYVYLRLSIVSIIIGVAGFYIIEGKIWTLSENDGTQPLSSYEELIDNFEVNIEEISHKFKKQHPNIWDEIYAGVVDVLENPEKRSIIFLFSNQDDPMICLAKMLGNATKAVLQSEENLWLAPSDFVEDYGEVIEEFRDRIGKQKIVIIEDILGINPEAMRAFHNFCDSENPLVRQTIYIITMIAKNFKEDEKPHVFVEQQLRQKLEGKINPDKLQPLITRLTDAAIIHVQPEPDIISCPLRY